MYEKWYTNVFGVISLRGPPRGPTFFLAPPEKMLKSTVFELEQWFLHQNGPFFHQEFNGKGLWVLGSQFCTKKLKNISEFQNSWNFWIFGSWTQPGAWHMIVPFLSWNLSDTTHVRSHTKFQLIWAINTAFTKVLLYINCTLWTQLTSLFRISLPPFQGIPNSWNIEYENIDIHKYFNNHFLFLKIRHTICFLLTTEHSSVSILANILTFHYICGLWKLPEGNPKINR